MVNSTGTTKGYAMSIGLILIAAVLMGLAVIVFASKIARLFVELMAINGVLSAGKLDFVSYARSNAVADAIFHTDKVLHEEQLRNKTKSLTNGIDAKKHGKIVDAILATREYSKNSEYQTTGTKQYIENLLDAEDTAAILSIQPGARNKVANMTVDEKNQQVIVHEGVTTKNIILDRLVTR